MNLKLYHICIYVQHIFLQEKRRRQSYVVLTISFEKRITSSVQKQEVPPV